MKVQTLGKFVSINEFVNIIDPVKKKS